MSEVSVTYKFKLYFDETINYLSFYWNEKSAASHFCVHGVMFD